MIETKQYYLMHGNHIAEILTLDVSDGKLVDSETLDEAHAPIGYADKKAFSSWWERRAIPKHQKNQAVLLDGMDYIEYMIQNLSLSMKNGNYSGQVEAEPRRP